MPTSDHPPDPSAEPELAREQAYLDRARLELARMRRKTEALRDGAVAADKVSGEFLALALHARVASLGDDPESTLFFGRLDMDHPVEGSHTWYVGRRHINDAAGDPVVIDWRAPLSSAFYRASHRDPLDVDRRRRFGVERGRLTAYEDEHLRDRREPERRSAILAAEIERPRVGPMRDIVATIQPEQDELVRADAATSICVQGAPGTGKTAVGLHRAAWLLYAHRDRLARSGVLIVGPNQAFLNHIGAVLPALGELDVRHQTAAAVVACAPVRASEPTQRAILKGDLRLAEVLRRAVWSQVRRAEEPLIVPRGAYRWRVSAGEANQIVDELRSRGVRYAAAGAMLAHRLAHQVLVAMERAGDSPDDRVQDSVARSAPVRSYAAALWPRLDPRAVLARLLSDPDHLATMADGVLDPDEQRVLLWDSAPRSKSSIRWTSADVVLLDELADLLERTPSLGHVILDEAQDLSPMHLRAVGRRCSTGSITVLGDLAQGTTAWAARSWTQALADLGKPQAHVQVLERGFRVPASVLGFATRLLPAIAPDLGNPESVRDNAGTLIVTPSTDRGLSAAVLQAVRQATELPGSVGVILSDRQVPRLSTALARGGLAHRVLGDDQPDLAERIEIVPATVAKGLEFDHVIVVEPADIVAAEPDRRTGLRRLYVVLTRAVSSLRVVHAQDLPPELGTPAG